MCHNSKETIEMGIEKEGRGKMMAKFGTVFTEGMARLHRAVLVGMTLLMLVFTRSGGPALGEGDDPHLWGPYSCNVAPEWVEDRNEWCQFVKADQNMRYLLTAVGVMANYGAAYLPSYEGFKNSEYACIRGGDLTNPYTGQPIAAESGEPQPGNLTWSVGEAGNLHLKFGYKLNGTPYVEEVNHFDAAFLANRREHPMTPIFSEDMTLAERHGAVCGRILEDFADTVFAAAVGRLPDSYEDLASHYPLVRSFWNWIQDRPMARIPFPLDPNVSEYDELPVALSALTAGDFTFEVAMGPPPLSLREMMIVVYGGNHSGETGADILYDSGLAGTSRM